MILSKRTTYLSNDTRGVLLRFVSWSEDEKQLNLGELILSRYPILSIPKVSLILINRRVRGGHLLQNTLHIIIRDF